MNKLTKEQKEKLLKAIELARMPGQCQYVENSQPCCVIGQLAYMEGASIDAMSKWDTGSSAFNGSVSIEDVENYLKTKEVFVLPSGLNKYPMKLLSNLQGLWDTSFDVHIKHTKEQMKSFVEDFSQAGGQDMDV